MIKINDVTKSYDERLVLNIEDLKFELDTIYAIMGANGCGKSTLLKSIMNLIAIDSGNIHLHSIDDIHYMPQHPYIFKGTARMNLFSDECALTLVESTDFKSLIDVDACKLSGGEKQKMLLLRAILQKKKVLILDEPTSDMDVQGTIAYENLLKEYQRDEKALIIIVTHSLAQSARFADHIIFMKDGEVIESGKSKDVIENPKSIEFKEFIEFHQI